MIAPHAHAKYADHGREMSLNGTVALVAGAWGGQRKDPGPQKPKRGCPDVDSENGRTGQSVAEAQLAADELGIGVRENPQPISRASRIHGCPECP
jgi:hypothetical protein